MKELGITHILQMGDFMDPKFPEFITYKVCPLIDFKDSNVKQYFEEGVRYIDDCINGDGICLVHWNAGVSRSGSMVCAYLMWKLGVSFDDALKMAQEKRPKILPNPGFCAQLREYEKEILK